MDGTEPVPGSTSAPSALGLEGAPRRLWPYDGVDQRAGDHHMSETQHPSVMITVYGKPKKKKTSDVLAAFPTALCIGVPSAIALVAENELGFTPAIHPEPPQTLPELVGLLDYLSRSGMAKQYGAVFVDDASHICDRSLAVWHEEAPLGKSGKKDKFYAYQQLNKYNVLIPIDKEFIKNNIFGHFWIHVLWKLTTI